MLVADGVEAQTCPADATDPAALTEALETLARRQGAPEVMCFSPLPDIGLIKPVLETTPAAIGTGEKHEPDAVADRLWRLHTEPPEPYTVLS